MKPNIVSKRHWYIYNVLFFIEHFLGEKLYNKLFSNTEKKLYKNILKGADQFPQTKEIHLIEVNDPKAEPFIDHYKPIVFKNLASDWECVKQWDFDFFAERYGDEKVSIINNKGLVEDKDTVITELTFKEYIDRLKKGTKDYLKFSRIVDEKGELIKQFDIKWLRKFRQKNARHDLFYFFMGGKGTRTPVHTAFAHTVFVQMYGQKKWTFYPTNNRLFLGARPRRFNYFFSEINTDNVNKEKFPLYDLSEPVEIIMNPGDVLFFPSFLWHQVENVSDTIGVAYKFADFKSGLKSSKMMTACLLLATKPPLFFSLFPWLPDTYNYKRKHLNKDRYEKI